MTQKVTREAHKWETNATKRQIGEHTRYYIKILGRLEDTYAEIADLVEKTGIVNVTNFDDYMDSTLESFCAFRTEVRKLMFNNIVENLGSARGDI